MCLSVMTPMIATMKVRADQMLAAAQGGFINATDLADYLVRKGLPFRAAYKISGQIVAYCIENHKVLETMTLDEYLKFDERFDNEIYGAIDLKNCVERRISEGGTSVASVEAQIKHVKHKMNLL